MPHGEHAESVKMSGGVGTWRYMAPEVARHQPYSDRADIYAFSLRLGEMGLCGLSSRTFHMGRVFDFSLKPALNPKYHDYYQNKSNLIDEAFFLIDWVPCSIMFTTGHVGAL